MRTIPIRAAFLALAAIQLGGCSSFLGINFARHSAPAAEPSVDVAIRAARVTEAGRRQLAEGQTGLAVETFRQALGSGEPVAPALNGLGVAYARLGRYDLAQRFFEQAMAADPADARYADNMTRLMRSPVLAMRRDADIAAAAQAQLAANRVEVQAKTAEAPAVGRIERLSRGEVRIVTATPQARPSAMTVQSASTRGFKPLVRVAFADKEAEQAKGFVRFSLPAPVKEDKPEASAMLVGPR